MINKQQKPKMTEDVESRYRFSRNAVCTCLELAKKGYERHWNLAGHMTCWGARD